ncbi:unnamed protein product [Prunus armeniaca]
MGRGSNPVKNTWSGQLLFFQDYFQLSLTLAPAQSTIPAEMVAFGLSIVSFETILLLLEPASIAGLSFFRSGQFRLTILTCGGGKGSMVTDGGFSASFSLPAVIPSCMTSLKTTQLLVE